MEFCAILRKYRCLPREAPAEVGNLDRLCQRIGEGCTAIGAGDVHQIVDGLPPAFANAGQAVADAHQATDVAGVAVGVPAGVVAMAIASVKSPLL